LRSPLISNQFAVNKNNLAINHKHKIKEKEREKGCKRKAEQLERKKKGAGISGIERWSEGECV
jgi:hypothetical protein